MGYVIGLLVALLLLLVSYIVYIQAQIRSISRQLRKRLTENTRQPVSLELINSDLNQLAHNINECLKAEEALRLSGVRDEKKFRELIADLSHDLRTPLTAIKGYQQLLEKEELTAGQRSKLQIAQKHTEELGQLIERFFEYSYLINTEPELNTERVNLSKLVMEGLISFITVLEEHKLAVHFDEAAPPVYIMADRKLVTRVIQNLIRNCIQHSSGDITVQLFVRDQAILSFQNPVKEPGELNTDRLFDRFYTGDKARSHSGGLGLAIVKLLTNQMGGSVGAAIEGELLDIRVTFPLLG